MYYKQIYVIFAPNICKYGAKYQVAIPQCVFWFDQDFTGNGAHTAQIGKNHLSELTKYGDIDSGKKAPNGN